jgi:hypothetical protein
MRTRLYSLLRKLLIDSRRPWVTVIRLLGRFTERLLSNPQIAELWRFIFLGTLVETGRIAGQKVIEALTSCTSITVPILVAISNFASFRLCSTCVILGSCGDITWYLSDNCFLLFRRFRI